MIFLLSTYGEGDPPDNVTQLWDWVNNATLDLTLSNLQYVALGLGNSNYKHYNRVVDVISEKLRMAGARQLLPTGKADDAHGGTEEGFLEWKEALFAYFRDTLHHAEKEQGYEPMLDVTELVHGDVPGVHTGEPNIRGQSKASMASCSPIHAIPIKAGTELFSSADRSCLHLEFDTSGFPDLRYKTGDHLVVWPMNPDTEVDRLIRVLGSFERRNIVLQIRPKDSLAKVQVHSPVTLDSLFRSYIDVCGPVSRELVLALRQFAPNQSARDRLTSIAWTKDNYARVQSQRCLNIGRILEFALQDDKGATWNSLPLSFLLENVRALAPRYYSISSSSVTAPEQPSITAVVMNNGLWGDRTTDGNSDDSVFGLTTSYLQSFMKTRSPFTYTTHGPANNPSSRTVYAHMRRSRFKLPRNPQRPVIMVAAGTGIAPFRGFIQERARMKDMGREVGQMLLFFGCRREAEDFLYRDEVVSLKYRLGSVLEVVTAFSREPGQRKVYVQHRVREYADRILQMISEQDAVIYVCGAAAMARDVASVMEAELGKKLAPDGKETDGEASFKRLKKVGQWMEDVW